MTFIMTFIVLGVRLYVSDLLSLLAI